MTDPSNPHEPTDPIGLLASPWPDVPALLAGLAPTDYPSGGHLPYGGPYAPDVPPGYDPQGAYELQPGHNASSGYSAPPGYDPVPAYGPPGYPSKSKVAADILALFLGTLGTHNFYLGYTGEALFQLLGTLLSCGFLTLPIAIWAFIEGILILVVRPGEAPWGVDTSDMSLSDRGVVRASRIPRTGIRATPPGGPGIVGPVLLSDHDIRTKLDTGRVVPSPYDPEMIQPVSIDARLGRWFRLFDNHRYPVINPAADQEGLAHLVDAGADEPLALHPGELVPGAIYERITLLDDVAARLEGESSLGHPELLTHSTVGFIDPGFTGHVTLEPSNTVIMPIKLWPGMKVGQLCFSRLSSPAQASYDSGVTGLRYQGQRGPTAFRPHQSFYRTRIPDTPATPADGVAPISQEKHP